MIYIRKSNFIFGDNPNSNKQGIKKLSITKFKRLSFLYSIIYGINLFIINQKWKKFNGQYLLLMQHY